MAPQPTSLQPDPSALPHRHRAILRAVDAGRGEVLCGCAPNLLIDGRFCDQVATYELFRAGLITAEPGPWGRRAAVRVTAAARPIIASSQQFSK